MKSPSLQPLLLTFGTASVLAGLGSLIGLQFAPASTRTVPRVSERAVRLATSWARPLRAEIGANVSLPFGTLAGVTLEQSLAWLGVPYASRFERFRPPREWQELFAGGVRLAQAFGDECMQGAMGVALVAVNQSEDCGFLNVYAPRFRSAAASLPVLVYLFGGAFYKGDSSAFNGSILAAEQDAIVVTVNYRLGPWGFLPLPSEASKGQATGNLGLQDQRAALKWVRRHIAVFGGDASRVLLFGQSSGAISICAHLTMEESAGLFSAALLESGHCEAKPLSTALAMAGTFCALAGCAEPGGTCDEECLRAASPSTLLGASDLKPAGFPAIWYPVVDGKGLREQPYSALAAGRFYRVPIVFGSNTDEGSLFVYGLPATTRAQLRELMAEYVLGMSVYFPRLAGANVDTLTDLYAGIGNGIQGDHRGGWAAGLADARYVCAATSAAALAARHTNVYHYHFDHRCSPGPFREFWGVPHSSEIQFVWGSYNASCAPTAADIRLSRAMAALWRQLAADGAVPDFWPRLAPGAPRAELPSLLLQPPPEDAAGEPPFRVERGWRTPQCLVWEPFFMP